MRNALGGRFVLSGLVGLVVLAGATLADDPPALNPFGTTAPERDDAVPGYVELSDGSVQPGQVYLTREARLKVFDEAEKRSRDVPLRAVRRIDCAVLKEWVEREWRFRENANDEKVYTGRNYPSREYVHTLTLADGRTIRGPLSAIVYVRPDDGEAVRFLLHKRDKGPVGTELKALTYVRSVRLGAEAAAEGRRRATAGKGNPGSRGERRP